MPVIYLFVLKSFLFLHWHVETIHIESSESICHMFCPFLFGYENNNCVLINHFVLISQTKTLSAHVESNNSKINIVTVF